MDGRIGAFSLHKLKRTTLLGCSVGIATVAGLLAFAPAWGQAMGKLALEGATPAPAVSRTVEPEKSDALKVAAGPALASGTGTAGNEMAVKLGVAGPAPAAAPVGGVTAPPAARTAAPLPDLKAIETPIRSATAPALGSAATAPAVAPGAATAEPKPDIEKTPIRRNGSEEKPAGGSSNNTSPLSGLGGTGQVIAALAIVVGLIFIGRALVRKFVPGAGASSGKGVIEILARHPLSKNQSLVLVRIGSQIVAINQGRDASQSVLVINEPMEVARIIGQIEGKSPDSIQAGFNKLLANARVDLENEPESSHVESRSLGEDDLDEQLEEMAAAKRQLMELRQHVRSVRDSLPREA